MVWLDPVTGRPAPLPAIIADSLRTVTTMTTAKALRT